MAAGAKVKNRPVTSHCRRGIWDQMGLGRMDQVVRWTRVEYELPGSACEVIICTASNLVTTGRYYRNGNIWEVHGECRVDVKLWMPFPLPASLPPGCPRPPKWTIYGNAPGDVTFSCTEHLPEMVSETTNYIVLYRHGVDMNQPACCYICSTSQEPERI